MSRKTISLFGATGSIGTSTLDVLRSHPEFHLLHYVFGTNLDRALQDIDEFKPDYAGCISKEHADILHARFPFLKNVFYGDGMVESASISCDIFVSAISGSNGLRSTMNAVPHTRRVALANKETMVMAGDLFNAACTKHAAELLPIDSEHSAIHQCLTGESPESIAQLILTASGGPFRALSKKELSLVTPEKALKHPNWVMGSKITIDSATLANKGLELIEASKLFFIPEDKIDVIVHPQSIIHSMVKFNDNSIKAQMGVPDMRLPIQYALTYPQRTHAVINDIDFTSLSVLTFEIPDLERFPSLRIAREALRAGGCMPLVFNRANEECVYAFLEKKIGFCDIARITELFCERYAHLAHCAATFEDILRIDEEIRETVKKEVEICRL